MLQEMEKMSQKTFKISQPVKIAEEIMVEKENSSKWQRFILIQLFLSGVYMFMLNYRTFHNFKTS
jgi:hypothetical protein